VTQSERDKYKYASIGALGTFFITLIFREAGLITYWILALGVLIYTIVWDRWEQEDNDT
jgi:predicted membrane channel-forming protein YqfA (hemolysin III family)